MAFQETLGVKELGAQVERMGKQELLVTPARLVRMADSAHVERVVFLERLESLDLLAQQDL